MQCKAIPIGLFKYEALASLVFVGFLICMESSNQLNMEAQLFSPPILHLSALYFVEVANRS